MEIKAFGRVLYFGKGHDNKETHSTIFEFGRTVPKASTPKPTERVLREFSRSAIPHRAISLVRDGVLAQNWRVVPAKAGDGRTYKQAIRAIENVIKHPNETDDYRTFWGQIVNETLIGDNGAAEIVFTGEAAQPIKLYPVNGFSLEYCHGFFENPQQPRFCQRRNQYSPVYLYDQDVLYIQHNKTTDSAFGLSPLESAFSQLWALKNAESYAGKQASSAIARNALNLGENVSEQDLRAFRKYFSEEVEGSGKTPIIGGTKGASSLKIGAEGDSELFLEWQKHLITIVALSFGIDPKKLGQGSNTDRSTVEEQNESMLNEAIRPICLLIQDAINEKIIKRLGLADAVKFEFYYEDTHDQKMKAQQLIVDQWNTNALTYKEYREKLGLPAVDSPYNDMSQAEMKSALNKKYAVQTGGFNGLGKDQKEGVDKKTNGEKGTKS